MVFYYKKKYVNRTDVIILLVFKIIVNMPLSRCPVSLGVSRMSRCPGCGFKEGFIDSSKKSLIDPPNSEDDAH